MTADMGIVKYSLADAEIKKLADEYLPLVLSGPTDKQGFELVHSCRMDVREKRIMVEKTRVKLKADALEYGRKVDSEAKRLTALLQPIESHLEQQEKVYTDEIARVRVEKEKALAAKTQARADALHAFGAKMDIADLQAISDASFVECLHDAEATFKEAEAKRKAEKEAADRAAEEQAVERERLAKAQAEAEKAKREAAEAQAAAEKATRDAQEAQRAAEAKVQAEKDKAAAVEKARVDEAARIKAAEQAEAERKAREDATKPERARIIGYACMLDDIAISAENADRPTSGPGLGLLERSMTDVAVDIIRETAQALRNLANQKA